LGLAVCEAMMSGMPVVGMATTELVTVIDDGVNGFAHTDINYLIARMKALLQDKALAVRIGGLGKETAVKRFNIRRFAEDWQLIFQMAVHKNIASDSRYAHTLS